MTFGKKMGIAFIKIQHNRFLKKNDYFEESFDVKPS
jgi:hypothetical protein